MSKPYIPSGGLAARLQRQAARFLAQDRIKSPRLRPLVSFSFDDFPQSARAITEQELEPRGWRATFYTACGFSGQSNHHGEMMRGADVTALYARGHEIACHTYSHIDCAKADPDTMLADIDRNTQALAALGIPAPVSFAFPFGEATPAAKRSLSERFMTLRGVRSDLNASQGFDARFLRSVPLDGGDEGIGAALRHIDQLARNGGWLIFYAHDVRDTPSDWGCTPDQFRRVVQAVETIGADVMTVRDAATAMGVTWTPT